MPRIDITLVSRKGLARKGGRKEEEGLGHRVWEKSSHKDHAGLSHGLKFLQSSSMYTNIEETLQHMNKSHQWISTSKKITTTLPFNPRSLEINATILYLRNLMRKHKAAYITATEDCTSHCSLWAEVRRSPHSESRTTTCEVKLEATIL